MDIKEWNERYRMGKHAAEDLYAAPTPLLVETATRLALSAPDCKAGKSPPRALDLACGSGRNALWLAEHRWTVTAVDGATDAISILRERAAERGLTPEILDTRVADLESGQFSIAPEAWDLIAICYYLQRDLFEAVKRGLVRGGVLLAIVHITETGQEPNAHRLRPGELEKYFQSWEILHRYEGIPHDDAHRHAVAEIVARRP